MIVVDVGVVERIAEYLRIRIKGLERAAFVLQFVDEEIAAVQIPPLLRIRAPQDVAPQAWMVDVHAVVEDCDRYSLPARRFPRLAGIDRGEVPLIGARSRDCRAPELGHEIRKGVRHFVGRCQFVRKLQDAFGDVLAARIVDDDLIDGVWVDFADPQFVFGKQRLAPRL